MPLEWDGRNCPHVTPGNRGSTPTARGHKLLRSGQWVKHESGAVAATHPQLQARSYRVSCTPSLGPCPLLWEDSIHLCLSHYCMLDTGRCLYGFTGLTADSVELQETWGVGFSKAVAVKTGAPGAGRNTSPMWGFGRQVECSRVGLQCPQKAHRPKTWLAVCGATGGGRILSR